MGFAHLQAIPFVHIGSIRHIRNPVSIEFDSLPSSLPVSVRAMVQVKHQKQKSKKEVQVKKKQGVRQADTKQFRAQLDALGLKIVQVTADGNCFFRALADQLKGNEDEHGKYRSMVVQFISKNCEMFEPFIEDEVPFDEYCRNMENDGTWAGHMELQAASLVTRCNICIHRNMSPRWYIHNFDHPGVRMVHLSYHDGEHYNSVRLKEDPGDGPARSIVIKADSDLSSSSQQAKGGVVNKSRGGASTNTVDAESIKVVMAGSGCENCEKVEQILQEMSGDVDAAIEYLVVEQGSEDASLLGSSFSSHADVCHGNDCDDAGLVSEQEKCDQIKETSRQDQPGSNVRRSHSNVVEDDKKISRNKACPCGSKKKYKSCCGSGIGRSSLTIVNQAMEPTKGTRGKRQGKKGGPPSSMTSGPDGEPPDMGALCI